MLHLIAGFAGRARTAGLVLFLGCLGPQGLTYGGPAPIPANPGDPLYCGPNEGVAFLIVNGGAGVFTVNADCYGGVILGNIANDTDTTIATGQGGTVTNHSGNYVYAPPTPGFTGLDTFNITVQTVWNGSGGTGSAGGSVQIGGPATLGIILNVIPASTTLSVSGPTLVPIPAGSITGCSAVGNPALGPPAGAVYGCITSIRRSSTVSPAHGTLVTSGSTLLYTPNAGFQGTDTFTYRAVGVNDDGLTALNSGDVTVTVTVLPVTVLATPTLSEWAMIALGLLLGGMGYLVMIRRMTQATGAY